MSKDLKVDYIEWPARDFDAVQTFYERVFNWSFTDYGPDYRAFSDGSIDGGFYRAEQQSSTTSGAALVVIYALDLEQTRAAVVAAGGCTRERHLFIPRWPPFSVHRPERQ